MLMCGCGTQPASSLIAPEGNTLETRILTPEGYRRSKASGFGAFVRSYKMKKDKSPLLLYNKKKASQSRHIAIFKLPIENYDLQQCADSIMRIYAEYFYKTKQYNKIKFHFVSGFLADYSKWRKGYSIQVTNDGKWIPTNEDHTTYNSFKKYMKIVFTYASTLSMDKESTPIQEKDLRIGDIFLRPGSPGHVIMVADVCEKDGHKAYLLAQGYTPACEFHVMVNPKHKEDPWYYEDEITYPLKTAPYTFDEGTCKRLTYDN